MIVTFLHYSYALRAEFFKIEPENYLDFYQNLTLLDSANKGMLKCAGTCALDDLCFGFVLHQPNSKCSTLRCARSDEFQQEVPQSLYAERSSGFANPRFLARGISRFNLVVVCVLIVY